MDEEIEKIKKEIEDCFYNGKNGLIIISPQQREEEHKIFYKEVKGNQNLKVYTAKGVYTTKNGDKLIQKSLVIIGKDADEKLAKEYMKKANSESVIYNNKIIFYDGTEKQFKELRYSDFINGDSTMLNYHGKKLTFQFA